MRSGLLTLFIFFYTDATFHDVVDSADFVLVEFFAPWCGHCKALAPEYEKAATALKESHPNVVIASVDATEEKAAAAEFGVQGFPTLKWFVNGKPSDYSGGRTEDTIVAWISKKTGPPTTTIASVEELEALKTANEVVAVGSFESEEAMKAFSEAAMNEESIVYASAIGNADIEAVVGKNSVKVFQQFDEGEASFDGDSSDAAAIGAFVTASSLPLVVPFTQQTAKAIFGGSVATQFLLFIDGSKADEATAAKDSARGLAKALKGSVLFVTIDKTDERVLEYFGVSESDIPTTRMVTLKDGAMIKYKDPQEDGSAPSEARIKAFCEAYAAGTLAADLKSAEPPTDNDGPVRVLVGKTFDEEVKAPGKNVLVEFYAPWCGHCKKLEPIWNELGEAFKENDSVVVAKMDATANEITSVSVSGFPTIKFFPADSDEIVDYDGGRDLEALTKFLNEKTA